LPSRITYIRSPGSPSEKITPLRGTRF